MKRFLVLSLCLCLLHGAAQAATTTFVQQSGTQDTWYLAGATLASNGQIYTPSAVTLTNAGHMFAWCTLSITGFNAVPTAGTAVIVWFRVSTDGGTTYPDGDSGTTVPAEPPNMIFPLRAANAAQVITFHVDRMPMTPFKLLIKNDGTGATINTAWSIKCRTYTLQTQ
jgi:hypothetical protein